MCHLNDKRKNISDCISIKVSGNSTEETNPTTLDQLDNVNLLSIFDRISLRDLVKMASLNPRFQQLIVRHYFIGKYRLHKDGVSLSAGHDISMRYLSKKHNFDTILAQGYDETLYVLRHFGYIFNYLEVNVYEYGYAFTAQMSDLVNKYCANANQEIGVQRAFGQENMTISLVNVTNVKIYHNSGTAQQDTFRLDLAFPHMTSLEISRRMDLDYHYSHLTEFTLHASDYHPNIDHFFKFLQFNPQLRKIHLPYFYNDTFVALTNELLPNLEAFSLEVLNQKYGGANATEITRFIHVKTFTIDLIILGAEFWTRELRQMLVSIQFDRLQSFSVATCYGDSINFLIDWIVGNTELDTVSFVGREMSFQQLSALIVPLNKLKVLTLRWTYASTLGELNRFLAHAIAMNGTIKQINVNRVKYGALGCKPILEAIPDGWYYNDQDIMQSSTLIQLYRAD